MKAGREGAQGARRGNAGDVYPELSSEIIDSAMQVHSRLGPGMLESVYEACLCVELGKKKLAIRRQVSVPAMYDEIALGHAFRLDIEVEGRVIVEVKAVDQLTAIHEAQLLTYLKFTGLPLGLLLNFNVAHLRHGILRRVMTRGSPAFPCVTPCAPCDPL